MANLPPSNSFQVRWKHPADLQRVVRWLWRALVTYSDQLAGWGNFPQISGGFVRESAPKTDAKKSFQGFGEFVGKNGSQILMVNPKCCRARRRNGNFWNMLMADPRLPWWFRNPANSPVEVGSLSHALQGFIHPRCFFWISEPSTVSPYRLAAILVSWSYFPRSLGGYILMLWKVTCSSWISIWWHTLWHGSGEFSM